MIRHLPQVPILVLATGTQVSMVVQEERQGEGVIVIEQMIALIIKVGLVNTLMEGAHNVIETLV
mgnify:FL=1